MNRIVERFRELGTERRAALVTYLTAGDPSIDETAHLVLEAARGGADVIELGVPFSDPSADGPVLQRAMERALGPGGAGGDTLGKTLAAVARVRQHSQVPIVLFGYYNPLLQRGLARVVNEAKEAGVDGFLVVDLPPEESEELDGLLAAAGLCRIPLLSPMTSLERARTIAARASGFAYYVGLTGVTGAGHLDLDEVKARVAALRPALGGLPLVVGFGIKDPESVRQLARVADGVVVGTALVAHIAAAPDPTSRRQAACDFVKSLATALR